jgi:hypothetical protein
MLTNESSIGRALLYRLPEISACPAHGGRKQAA